MRKENYNVTLDNATIAGIVMMLNKVDNNMAFAALFWSASNNSARFKLNDADGIADKIIKTDFINESSNGIGNNIAQTTIGNIINLIKLDTYVFQSVNSSFNGAKANLIPK